VRLVACYEIDTLNATQKVEKVDEPFPGGKYIYQGNRILEHIRWRLESEEDEKLFLEILEKCQKYSLAINAKGKPFPTEPLIMALLLQQHKMINWLQKKYLCPNRSSLSLVWNRTCLNVYTLLLYGRFKKYSSFAILKRKLIVLSLSRRYSG
jgi:hypothetical protein